MRDFVMKWDDMEYTGHRNFFYVLVVVPEELFMLRSHNVSQQVRWRDGRLAKLGLRTMLEDLLLLVARTRHVANTCPPRSLS